MDRAAYDCTYENLTLRAETEDTPIEPADWAFTAAIDALVC